MNDDDGDLSQAYDRECQVSTRGQKRKVVFLHKATFIYLCIQVGNYLTKKKFMHGKRFVEMLLIRS